MELCAEPSVYEAGAEWAEFQVVYTPVSPLNNTAVADIDRCEWHPIVAIPARNEADRLPTLISSLSKQSWVARKGRRLNVVLVVNNSEDGSAEVARSVGENHPNLILDVIEIDFPHEVAHVGSARRLAMERAWQMTTIPSLCVLLTTDADAAPTPTWIDANLNAINAGADIVGGQIIGDEVEEAALGARFLRRAKRNLRYLSLVDYLTALIDPLPYDPWPRHFDHTGASLAVRAEVYSAVGGMAALPFREDISFVSRVRGAAYRLRHSSDVRVKVSARLEGRALGGMAECIKGWVRAEEFGLPHLVEKPHSVAERIRRRRYSRDVASADRLKLGNTGSGSNFVPTYPIPESELSAYAKIEDIASDEPDAACSVPVEMAITEIEGIIADTQSKIRASGIFSAGWLR
jgi:hypothetical protein